MARTLKQPHVVIIKEGGELKIYGHGQLGTTDDPELSKPIRMQGELSSELQLKASDLLAAVEAQLKSENNIP